MSGTISGKTAHEVPQSTSPSAPEGVESEEEALRIGKDEMNLVEYPFAALSREVKTDAVIEHEWETRHPISKKLVKASWRVAGDPKLGLPTAIDERVYLVLMEITKEAGFQDQAVSFTRYDLIQRLGWPNNQKHYEMLLQSFERLKSVVITARNAFWDSDAKTFRSVGFNILDNFNVAAERPGRKAKSGQRQMPLSYFRWNEVIFSNAKNGYIKSLDLNFALSLSLPLSLRLFRFLDKKAYGGRETFEIELRRLCEIHLGMTKTPHLSTYKVRLKAAHTELVERGFLHDVSYLPMKTKKSEKVSYTFVSKKAPPMPPPKPLVATIHSAPGDLGTGPSLGTGHFLEDRLPMPAAPTNDSAAISPHPPLLEEMLALNISPEVAHTLLQNVSPGTLRDQLNCLDDREPRDRAATFVKAVREGWQLPSKYLERLEAQNRAQEARTHQESQKRRKAAEEAIAGQEKAAEEAESLQLDALWEKLDDSTREEIEAQARQRLGVLGQSGRAQGALIAMRRNLLRERLAQKEVP